MSGKASQVRKIAVLMVYIYALAAYFILYLLNADLPPWLENSIVIFALPLQAITLPLLPLLRILGATQGTWQVVPTFWGVLLVSTCWGALLYLLITLFNWRRKDTN